MYLPFYVSFPQLICLCHICSDKWLNTVPCHTALYSRGSYVLTVHRLNLIRKVLYVVSSPLTKHKHFYKIFTARCNQVEVAEECSVKLHERGGHCGFIEYMASDVILSFKLLRMALQRYSFKMPLNCVSFVKKNGPRTFPARKQL